MTTKPPTPYQALLASGLSDADAQTALLAMIKGGFVPTYDGPKEAFGTSIAIQIFAHSAEHADEIFTASGLQDGAAEIHQDGIVLKVDYINVEGCDFKPMFWSDESVDTALYSAGVDPDDDLRRATT